MPYIGKQPLTGAYQLCDTITTSATATYNLLVGGSAVIPGSANNCIVSLNGVVQAPVGAFTVSGSTITFASTLSATDVIDFILILGNVFDIGKPTDGSVTNASIANGTINLTTKVTGTLPTSNGGTGLTTIGTAGQALVVNGGATGLQYSTVGATAGQVIQVLGATDSTERTTTSTSFVTASNTLSVTITPSSTSNKILIIVNSSLYHPDVGNYFFGTIYRGATDLGAASNKGLLAMYNGGSDGASPLAMSYLDSPSTTSATTYQVYIRTTGPGILRLNIQNTKSSITCLEIKG
jgi:hypothetical protein